MLLEGTNAIVFAAPGAIGSAVAREFGAAGAALFVSGRSAEAVAELREALEAAGVRAEAAVVDATDEEAVTAWVDRVLGVAGEFGPAGVRVNCVRAGGMPETRTIEETTSRMRAALGLPEHAQPPGFNNAMERPVTVTETARTVALLGSRATSGMTGQVVNVCAGQLIG